VLARAGSDAVDPYEAADRVLEAFGPPEPSGEAPPPLHPRAVVKGL
jgi:hypothetical protein